MNLGSGLAGAVVRGGRVNFAQIAADAFNNALGSAIVGEMAKSEQQEKLAAEQAAREQENARDADLWRLMNQSPGRQPLNPNFTPKGQGLMRWSCWASLEPWTQTSRPRARGLRRASNPMAGCSQPPSNQTQGPLAALADLGLNAQQPPAMATC